jgi:ABC-type multidrug transport system ATPase subunit
MAERCQRSQPLLAASKVTKQFGKFKALDEVSFTVQKGEAALLIGPNGAGKTTLVKCVLGLLRYKGNITVDERNVFNDGGKARAKIGYVPQALSFGYDTSIEEQAFLVAKLKKAPKEEAVAALKDANLWEIRRRKVTSLSHGMRQKLGISLAMLTDPPLLIFDEPINNVDLKGQLEFRSRVEDLTKKGKTLLIATHLSGLSEFMATAIVLHRGKIIAQGTPKDLLTRMNAADTLYLRLNEGDGPKVVEMIEKHFEHHHDEDSAEGHKVRQNKDWLVFGLPPGMKATLLKEIQDAGYEIKDLIIEPSTIESQYVKLLGEVAPAR